MNEYNVEKQVLTNEIKYTNKDMDAAKKGLAEPGRRTPAAEGDLPAATKTPNEDVLALANPHVDCMTRAEDFEAKTTS